MHRKAILAATIAITGLLADSSCASATAYTFTTLDVPGAANTRAFGINDLGQIVGFFNTSAEGHGFLYSGGSFTSIDPPGALGRSGANGINNTGEIVGSSNTGQGHGFLRGADGSFTSIDIPGASGFGTFASGINGRGQIVGTFFTSPGELPDQHGFLRDADGSFTTIDAPAAFSTDARGINGAGEIVGDFEDGTGGHGFLRDAGGNIITLDVPGASATDALGINDAGQIVGDFLLGTRIHGLVRETDGNFATLDVPDASSTEAWGINDAGQIVGVFGDKTGADHGFLATPVSPVPEPSGLAVVGLGLIGLIAMLRRQSAPYKTRARTRERDGRLIAERGVQALAIVDLVDRDSALRLKPLDLENHSALLVRVAPCARHLAHKTGRRGSSLVPIAFKSRIDLRAWESDLPGHSFGQLAAR